MRGDRERSRHLVKRAAVVQHRPADAPAPGANLSPAGAFAFEMGAPRGVECAGIERPGGDALAVYQQRHVAQIHEPGLRPAIGARDLEDHVIDAIAG